MSDLRTMDEASTKLETGAGNTRFQLRDRMRDRIRAEVERLNPTDDARRALELIIESSVRPSTVDGELRLTVIDRSGQPRTIDRDGRTVDFTLSDLVDELRASHPVLFKAPSQPKAEAVPAGAAAPQSLQKAYAHPQEKQEIRRDWLKIAPDEPPASAPSQSPGGSRFHLRRGKMRLHGWSHNIAMAWKASAPNRARGLNTMRDSFSASAERARTLIDQVQERPLHKRPGFALSVVAVLALLGAGAFMLPGSDASQEASAEEPLVTGTISSPRVAAQASASRSSGMRTLRGVPDVIDTATLSLNGEVVRLFGVEWAPGAGKPEDLTRYLQGREVTCEPAGGNETYRCQVGEQDLSKVVLFNGGGQPTAEATPELKAAADKAREAKIGVWSSSAGQ